MTTSWNIPTRPTGAVFNPRSEVNTSWGGRLDVSFLMTQALDFLMTEDGNYIVLQNSYTLDQPQNNSWNIRPII